MIYVDMKGNIGNQMFNYALARMLQYKTNQKIVINTYNLENRHKDYIFNLNIFKLNKDVIFENRKLPVLCSTESKWYLLFKKVFGKRFEQIAYKILNKFNIFLWERDEYKEIVIRNKKNIYISGFFQSTKYFREIKEILKDEFSFDDLHLEFDNDLYNVIKRENSVCVSIRRGDYVNDPIIAKKHFVCDREYFNKALDFIIKKEENPFLIFFSNDIEWAKTEFANYKNSYFENPKNTIREKIILMKECKNFVLSNSTFSWWTEFLSNNENKDVVAPNVWYTDGRHTDIYQDYWNIIHVK